MKRTPNILSGGALIYAHDTQGQAWWRHPFTGRTCHETPVLSKEGQEDGVYYELYESRLCEDPNCEANHLIPAATTPDLQKALDWICAIEQGGLQ